MSIYIKTLEDNLHSPVELFLEHKIRDDFSDSNKYYPLISNIDDLAGVIFEHRLLNNNNDYLQYALFKYNNKYYFFDVRTNTTELKMYVDDKSFICPFCKQDLIPISPHIRTNKDGSISSIPAHLRHKNNDESIKVCIFNSKYKLAQQEKERLWASESVIHRGIKLRMEHLIKRNGLKIYLPTEFEIIRNDTIFSSEVNFKYDMVNITDVDVEVTALVKNDSTNGYRPDLTFITETGDKIFCEVTVTSGKTVSEYYDIWRSLNKPVIEIVYCKNKGYNPTEYEVLENLSRIDFLDKKAEVLILNNATMRFLYSPVIDAARREHHKVKAIQADKKKTQVARLINSKKQNISLSVNEKELNDLIISVVYSYAEKENIQIYYNKFRKVWLGSNYEELQSEPRIIYYKNCELPFNLPSIVWDILKINGFKIDFR